MVKNDDYTCLFCLDKINKFCRESLVKTIVSFRKIFLDRFLYVVVEYNPRSFTYNLFFLLKVNWRDDIGNNQYAYCRVFKNV